MIRRAAHIVRSAVLALAFSGLASCTELGPTAGPASSEAPAVTALALDGDAPSYPWAAFATEARSAYSGVELGDRGVLVCGGSNTSGGPNYVMTCNRLSFDGTLHSQSFPLPEARMFGTLSLVPPNRVLLAGGNDASNHALTARLSLPVDSWSDGQGIWGSAEANSDSPTPRAGQTATRLDSNVVLIGGYAGVSQVGSIDVRSDQGTWINADSNSVLSARSGHSATLLKGQSGGARVLVLGGYSQAQGGYLSSGFIFSPPNTLTPIADMPEPRQSHTATLLEDGSVLVVGGEGPTAAFLSTAWRYYPDEDRWANAGSTVPRKSHAAARLGADVIIAGGVSPTGVLSGIQDSSPNSNTVQRYNPATNAWSPAPNLLHGRREFQLFKLDETHLLAVGGANQSGTLSNSEVLTAGALGQVASDLNSCVSGHNADGVCCDTECGGPCHWCNDPAAPGICQLVTGTAQNQNGCANHLQCSAGACAAQCDANFVCEAGFFCVNGTCQATKGIGATCSAASECASGAPCVDGVCCESSCSGACEACNQPDRLGLCRPLAEGDAPREGHPLCPSAHDSTCAATCDGHTVDRCVFRASGSLCAAASCSDEGFQPARECDGNGICVAATTPVSCSPYACDSNGCLNACRENSECSDDNHCKAGTCTANCVEDDCNESGYRCDAQSHECRNTCERSETDCAGGYYCHPLQRQCVKGVAFPAASLPACGIGNGTARPSRSSALLASLLCALAALRRRRVKRRLESRPVS